MNHVWKGLIAILLGFALMFLGIISEGIFPLAGYVIGDVGILLIFLGPMTFWIILPLKEGCFDKSKKWYKNPRCVVPLLPLLMLIIVFYTGFFSYVLYPPPLAPTPASQHTPSPASPLTPTPTLIAPTPAPPLTPTSAPSPTRTSAPSPTPTSAPPIDLSEIVEDELKKLAPGQILFNSPQEMKVGVRERVEVRIAKTITENLTVGLRGRGVPQIEEIRVGTFMKVRLTGDNFDIKALSHEEQVVAGEGFTQWDWDVTPLESGSQSLLLIVTVRIKIPDYDEERIDYPVFERQIKVKVNPIYSIIHFIESYWHWIISTIIGSGIIGWIVKKRRRSSKKK